VADPQIAFPAGVYSDVRVETRSKTVITTLNGEVIDATTHNTRGAFVRVLRGGIWRMASTTDLSEISGLLESLASGDDVANDTAFDPSERLVPHQATVHRYQDQRVTEISMADKLTLLRRFAGPVSTCELLRQHRAIYADFHQERLFRSSRGAEVRTDHQQAGLALAVTVAHEDSTFSDSLQVAEPSFDILLDQDHESRVGNWLERVERYVRDAVPIEPGKYPVILAPAVAGVFAHESFGHKSEADFMLGDVASLESWKIGSQVGAETLSIVDDGALTGSGYTPYDDEGQPASKTWLIKDGLLRGRLHSAETATALEESTTGNARAMNFKFEPIVRMTSTYIEAGSDTREQLFERVQDGYYLETFKHGSGMSTFTIAPSLAWRVRDGKIAEPVRINVATGSVFETLGLIEAVSDEVQLTPSVMGGCGKMEQFPLPVAFGGPFVLVSEMNLA